MGSGVSALYSYERSFVNVHRIREYSVYLYVYIRIYTYMYTETSTYRKRYKLQLVARDASGSLRFAQATKLKIQN